MLKQETSQKKILIFAFGAVFYGLFFAGFALRDIKEDVDLMLVIIGSLLTIAIGCLLTIAGFGDVIFLRKRRVTVEDDNLNRLFYELLKKNKGKITALEFAIVTNKNPAQARAFIEANAVQFATVSDIYEDGTII